MFTWLDSCWLRWPPSVNLSGCEVNVSQLLDEFIGRSDSLVDMVKSNTEGYHRNQQHMPSEQRERGGHHAAQLLPHSRIAQQGRYAFVSIVAM